MSDSECSCSTEDQAEVIRELMLSSVNGRRIYSSLCKYVHLISLGPYLGPVHTAGYIIRTRSPEETILYISSDDARPNRSPYNLFIGSTLVLQTDSAEEMVNKIKEIV